MTTKEIIEHIESNGGIDTPMIYRTYLDDIRNNRIKPISLEKYFSDYIKNNYNCSYYVANKVMLYYL